jgi:hypothetical protein
MNEMEETMEMTAELSNDESGRKSRAQILDEKLANLYGEGYTRITLEQLSEVSKDFVEFVKTYLRPYRTLNGYDKKYLTYKVSRQDGTVGYIFELCTSANKYRIFIDAEKNFMKCFAKCRTTRVGEKYPRGNDLPYGDITKDTFEKILFAIINYETLSIGAH